MTHADANETVEVKATWELYNNATSYSEQIKSAASLETQAVGPLTFYLTKLYGRLLISQTILV